MTSIIVYKGDLRTELTHQHNHAIIENDAPVDNQGKGEFFSPTDMVASALGSCMAITMGIKAKQLGVDLQGMRVEITKIMGTEPRRIAEIKAYFFFPAQHNIDEKSRIILERVAYTCPVEKSLHPDLKLDIQFNW